MIRLGLLRHGHTIWNRDGRLQGRTDIPLDADARDALEHLALPDDWNEADLWSSPLQRAVETACLVAGRSPRTTPALTEMDWGIWEGMRRVDLFDDPGADYRDIEDWGWNYRPPGGETPAEMRTRLQPWADSLAVSTVAVCHIGVMRVLLALATGWQFSGPAPFQIKRNRLYIIRISDLGWTLEPGQVRLERSDP